jgi:tagaturonate reductase
MPSFLEYIEKFGKLPEALTMSLAAYIAFYSNDIQRLDETGLVCKRPAGNEYTVSDDAWVLQFYYDHKDADAKTLVHDVLTNEKMWGQDLTQIEGLEDKVVEDLQLIREQGAEAAYASVL